VKSQELTSSTNNSASESQRAAIASPTVEAGLNAVRTVYWWILIMLLVAYAFSGTTQIAPGEVGLIQRFGRWVKINDHVVIHRPGLLFALPRPFDRVEKIPVKQERIVEIRLLPVESQESEDAKSEISNLKSEMPKDEQASPPTTPSSTNRSSTDLNSVELTSANTSSARPQYLLAGDRGILGLSLQVRYRIADPAAWLLASSDVDAVIQRIVVGATSSVIAQWTSDDVLRRQKRTGDDASLSLQSAVLDVVTTQVSELQLGVELSAIEFTSIQPPAAVRDAFVAIQDARVDQESWKEEANGEAAEVHLNSERMAQVAIADANGKLDSILGKVAAEIELFDADRAAFEAGSSKLIASRIQRETWEAILRSAGRVIAVPSGERSQGLWLSVPDAENSK